MCNCTSENLEIPDMVLTHHSGMTEEELRHFPKSSRILAWIFAMPAIQRS
ncbi:hypothetical protein SAMN05444169_0712 [Bradyrhizobium erythrophlei]|uniref:Uncharacterized protein n=1 Tax=Bradyrhizobium erythrophlei TaxID=1437360 RepID=A0A1M5HBF9_9BRAD|nr:hypothetical protein SAMN05444169_0712 [Bradyrhizobium erythrophlei]